MSKRKRPSVKPSARPSRKAHGAKRAAKVLDRLDKADRQVIADAHNPNAWEDVPNPLQDPTTPDLARYLRDLADGAPLTGDGREVLRQSADRLDWYAGADAKIVAGVMTRVRQAQADVERPKVGKVHLEVHTYRQARKLAQQGTYAALGKEAAAAHSARTPARSRTRKGRR
jgi:hypothetical protein